jgi:hypothetical protein
MRKLSSLVVASLMLSVGITLTINAPRAVASAPAVLRVLMLGDSYMAGNGSREILPDGSKAMDFYGPDLCFRSRATWAEQWAGD